MKKNYPTKHNKKDIDKIPIVSSSHLAGTDDWETSELEYSIIVAYNAFSRWVSYALRAAEPELNSFSPITILILHNVNHRKKPKKISDIAFTLNIEDIHIVNYAIKKLLANKLITSKKEGKEIFYSSTEKGQNICKKYANIRENCLLRTIDSLDLNYEYIRDVADILRTMSGIYDQASRSASSL